MFAHIQSQSLPLIKRVRVFNFISLVESIPVFFFQSKAKVEDDSILIKSTVFTYTPAVYNYADSQLTND